jgi:hypothetical protein
MAEADIAPEGLARVAERFPEAAASLRRLVATDPRFREICEEYGLARQSLAGFEARPDAAERPEIVRALVVGGNLEGAAGAGRGLLEDQADPCRGAARARCRNTSPASGRARGRAGRASRAG